MSPIDQYVARVRRRARGMLSAESERELRSHVEAAIAESRAAGTSPEEAEIAALAQLGDPDVVARAFRREPRPRLLRVAGRPGSIVAGVRQDVRAVLLATVVAALCGGMFGRLLPPTYHARVPLSVVGPRDFGSGLGVAEALRRLRDIQGVRLSLRDTTVEASGGTPTAATALAVAEANRAVEEFPSAYRQTRYGDRPMRLQVQGQPVVVAEGMGGRLAATTGLLGLVTALALRSRQRRVGRR